MLSTHLAIYSSFFLFFCDLILFHLISSYLICTNVLDIIHLSIYPSIYASIYASIYLSVCLSIYLSVYPFQPMPMKIQSNLPIHSEPICSSSSICLFICLSICLFIYQFIYQLSSKSCSSPATKFNARFKVPRNQHSVLQSTAHVAKCARDSPKCCACRTN